VVLQDKEIAVVMDLLLVSMVQAVVAVLVQMAV
jgi:hypothetical protein